ncbi:alpha/beta hydrolase [Streptomyces sp. XM83C]|jgi:pimeloyl-ACP methyl ester carboxylesterase|uniref:alpha/beta hydrolase n=1 Tax=unclassified Streptomyces TaxID=2593676 RepID=UPI001FF84841|nr:alpha/beta hydrolase [Streptomyces sp. XM83C]MCK1819823.1 alpha/beta hydrolase [Streptomyces sp. XM83C]
MLAKLSTRCAALRRGALLGTAVLVLLTGGLPAAAGDAKDASRPDLSRFYEQKVSWSRCKGDGMPKDLECGKVTVPLDYARPGGATLDLAVARYRAAGHRTGSVVLNFGGPGGPGVAQLAASGKEFMGLTDNYDVVSFDPRGVGRSSPVSCGDRDDVLAIEGSATVDDPAKVLGQLRRAAAACEKHSGPVLRHIGTVDAAKDLDVIRQALGDRKLTYLGFSYGTRLGAVYAALFPGKVGRMALDGVDTLTEPLTEQALVGAHGQQVALDGFVDWCVRDIACPFGQDARTARQAVVDLVRSLDRDPLPTGFGRPFTGQDLVGAMGQALYSKELWPSLERALAELVQDGDASGIAGFSLGGYALPLRTPGGGGLVDPQEVPLDNLPAALMAINCADDPDRPDAARLTRELGRMRAAFEHASPVFGQFRMTEVLLCYGRPKGTDFIRERVKDLDTPKMLLVGTRGDPATPYRWTVETAERLGPSAVVLDNRGEGHTGYASSKCVHGKVDTFLLYGTLPPSGSSCAADTEGRGTR